MRKLLEKLFLKYQYDTDLLRKISKVLSPLFYLTVPLNIIKGLFSTKHYPKTLSASNPLVKHILNKATIYHPLTRMHQGSVGFIDTQHCDSLLFTGLLSYAAPDPKTNICAARDQNGRWFRRPLRYGSCYEKGQKGSTISRDMLMGLLYHFWAHKDKSNLGQLYRYGKKNDWVMGDGDISRVYLTPGLRKTIALMWEAMGGPCHKDSYLSHSWPKGLKDYEAHLSLLHINLLGEIHGYITTPMKEAIKDIAYGDMTQNPFAQLMLAKWVTGKFDTPLIQMSLEHPWPDYRLPTTHDRKESWINQRSDSSSGWLKVLDEPAEEHHGADFLFCVKVLKGCLK